MTEEAGNNPNILAFQDRCRRERVAQPVRGGLAQALRLRFVAKSLDV